MIRIRFIIGIFLLGFAPLVDAAYWVIDFKGPASDYVLRRGDAEITLEKLTLLNGGDVVIVNNAAGKIILVDQANTRHVVLADDSPFSVPDSEASPGLLSNVRDWVESWWNTRGNQSTKTVAAVTKGGLDPEFVGATNGPAMILSGTRSLQVSWRGGIAPYSLRLTSASGEAVADLSGIRETSAMLASLSLPAGDYTLQVAAGSAPDVLTLSVVEEERLPERAREILALDVPEEVRFGHLAMFLATSDPWRFEALQLAREYDLVQLVYTLENYR